MTLWTDQAAAAATGGAITAPFAATGVSIDSRTLRPGDLFVALVGEHGDGHDHLAAAFARGAAGAIVHQERACGGPMVRVADTAAALTALGRAGRARYCGPVIAVTGSVGKTTTKEMLLLCLSQGSEAHASEASHNNHWGVPLTLARLPAEASACVVEIGMNHAGEIAPLSRLARPTVAVITNVGAAHLGHLGSLEAIADEKAAIGAGLAADGIAILPADTKLLGRLRAGIGGRRVVTFGAAEVADVWLTDLEQGPDGSVVTAVLAGRPIGVRLNVPGRHMALNALAALAATAAAGLSVTVAADLLGGFSAGAGRGAKRRIVAPRGTALLLDESYNASAASIRAALDVLALQTATRRLVVLGDIRELGVHAAAEHAGLAAPVAAVADLVFTCGPEMRRVFDAVPPSLQGGHAETAEALAPIVAEAVRAGDAVLVKGSHGSRMRLVVQALDTARIQAA